MKTAHAIAWPSAGDPPRRFRSQLAARVNARLRAPSLDRDLASGIAPWRSSLHAARALQLTSDRNRRGLARSLERLVENAHQQRSQNRGAVVYPCREQVIEAMPALLTIAGRLRSADPGDARGVARLIILLSDGSGPCYVRIRRNALTDALQEISQWLAVPR
jgi:hypothetical protein